MYRVLKLMVIGYLLIISWSCIKEDTVKMMPRYKDLTDRSTSGINLRIPTIKHHLSSPNTHHFEIHASVYDQANSIIRNLNKYNFSLYVQCNNDNLICMESFNLWFCQGEMPLAVSIILDYSSNLEANKLLTIEDAIKRFIRLLGPDDFVQIIKFADSVKVFHPFTNDIIQIFEAIEAPFGGTESAYQDATHKGISELAVFLDQATTQFSPMAIPIIAGTDSISSTHVYEIIALANKTQIPIYPIGIGTPNDFVINYTSLRNLAFHTGGKYFIPNQLSELETCLSTIHGQSCGIYRLSWQMQEIECDFMQVFLEVRYDNGLGSHIGNTVKQFVFPMD